MSTVISDGKFDLSGQVALVTGGGRGLGRAFAQELASEGAVVAVTARTESELAETVALIEASGGAAMAFTGDVTDQTAVDRVVESVENRLGPVDILANNAGVLGPSGRDWEVDVDDWWRTFDVNLRGTFLYARAVLPKMISRHVGRIINISSASVNIHLPYASAYGVSKAALTYLSNCLDSATKEYGVFVFAYAPGFVRTDMVDQVAESYNIRRSVVDIYRKRLEDDHDTTLERAVQVFMFLASGRADALSGRHIDVYDDETDLVGASRRNPPNRSLHPAKKSLVALVQDLHLHRPVANQSWSTHNRRLVSCFQPKAKYWGRPHAHLYAQRASLSVPSTHLLAGNGTADGLRQGRRCWFREILPVSS